MAGVTVRPARLDELPYLQKRLEESVHEHVRLDRAIVYVAEQDGQVIGLLPGRLVWQLEPNYVFPEVKNKATRARAGLGMLRAVEAWIADRNCNQTGVYMAFAVVRKRSVWPWIARLGWWRIYQGARFYVKHF